VLLEKNGDALATMLRSGRYVDRPSIYFVLNMKVKAPFQGYFHVHEPETVQIAGRVEFDVMSGIRLSTIGSFHQNDRLSGGEQRWDCIHGSATNGRLLTLLDCRGHEDTSIPGIPEGSFSSACMLVGHQHFDSSVPKIKSSAFRVTFLDEWLNRSGVSYESSRTEHGSFTATHKHQGAISLHTGSRLKVSIWHHTTTPMFGGHDVLRKFKEQAYLNVEYVELTTIEQAREDMIMLRDLFSLFMSTPIVVQDAVVYIEGEKEDEGRRFEIYFPLGYEYPSHEEHRGQYMVLPFDDIESSVGDMIGRWVDLYPSVKRGISFYHESYFSRTRHAFQKFTDYVFSYESTNRALHEMERFPTEEYASLRQQIMARLEPKYTDFMNGVLAYANEATLRQRLKASFIRTELSTVFNKKAMNLHIDRVVNARNNIVHYAEINNNENVSEENVIEYNMLLRLITVAELLLAIGVPQSDLLSRLKRNSNFGFLLSGQTLTTKVD